MDKQQGAKSQAEPALLLSESTHVDVLQGAIVCADTQSRVKDVHANPERI